jgi:hypothetical protein
MARMRCVRAITSEDSESCQAFREAIDETRYHIRQHLYAYDPIARYKCRTNTDESTTTTTSHAARPDSSCRILGMVARPDPLIIAQIFSSSVTLRIAVTCA